VRNVSFKEISEPSTYLIYTSNREFKSNHPEKNLNVEGDVTKKIMVFEFCKPKDHLFSII
jgi:hypothetical protein